MLIASFPETPSLSEQVQSLLATGECPRNEVAELQQENSDLLQQVRELRCDVGYWKSRHADAVKRIVILQAELLQAKAEIRQLKSERFGKRSDTARASGFVRIGKGYPEQNSWALKWLGQIRELYRLDRERLQNELGSAEYIAADVKLREHVAMVALERDAELSLAELQPAQLHYACLPALKSLREHWAGLTLFVDDPMVPLDNNYGERFIRNPAIGRKNYYGSGSE